MKLVEKELTLLNYPPTFIHKVMKRLTETRPENPLWRQLLKLYNSE